MSIRSQTSRHLIDHYRYTVAEGGVGQSKTPTLLEANVRTGAHPRGSLQNMDAMQFGNETDVDFFFDNNPNVKVEDQFRNLRMADGTAITPAVTYKVDGHAVNLGMKNRLWRVPCVVQTNR